ncbi:hypothetical protein ACFTZK_14770 [Streptomyces decoyicus]|uniref:hypothetical protein n=1 Tax=Streptomyces decoyicus TaxID=249567 RepID=UPI0036269A47
MSTDAEFADARHIPPIPPQPPRRPAAAPEPAEDPQTAVLRRVPPAPSSAPAAPSGPTAPPVPPRPAAPPRVQQPPAGAQPPPRPDRAPGSPAPTAPAAPGTPPPPAARPAAFRDTAAFHLANSQELWSGPGERGAGQGTREPASAPSPAAPGSRPPGPAVERPSQLPWPRNPLPPQGVGPTAGVPAAPSRRPGARVLAAAACLVLGIGLLGGAAAGGWLTEKAVGAPPDAEAAFAKGHDVWRNTPVDTLFPRTVNGLGVGPGGADRTWTRIAVAPDSGCNGAFDPKLAGALAPAGCVRLLRATYIDATRSGFITVGAQITKADQAGMMALNTRFSTKNLGIRTDLMPLPYAAKGTLAADFGRAQRASWTVRVLTDLPAVVFAVSGFADGRTFTDPQPAEAATRPGATTAPAESGLGHDAKDLADRIEADLRKAAGSPTQTREASS